MDLFISHIHEESEIAKAIKEELETCFGGGNLNVFLAEDIRLGVKWLEEIKGQLIKSDILLVLFSKHSFSRPWINIEAGYGVIAEKVVIPVCCPSLSHSDLPVIFSSLQAVDLLNGDQIIRLFDQISRKISKNTDNKGFNIETEEIVNRWLNKISNAIRSTLSDVDSREGRTFALCLPISDSDRDEFNNELKCHLIENLVKEGIKLLDYCPQITVGDDAHTILNLQEKITNISNLPSDKSPDYLLLLWPYLANDQDQKQVISLLKKLVKRGCRIAFINEFPDLDEADPDFSGKVVYVSVDESQAIKYLCQYIKNHISMNGRVLLINANQNFKVAKKRKNIYEDTLCQHGIVFKSRDISSWEMEDAKIAVMEELKMLYETSSNAIYDVIATANDNMAAGAVEALHEYYEGNDFKPEIKVVGYDGLPTAIRMIKDRDSNFVATLAAHPRSFAQKIFEGLCKPTTYTGIIEQLVPIFRTDLKSK